MKHFLMQLFVGLLALLFLAAVVQGRGYNIEILATFDYPGSHVISTIPLGINDAGDIVGEFTDDTGRVRGFIRYADGTFSDPIIEPNECCNIHITRTSGIANNGDICGNYSAEIGTQSFILSGGIFTEFQVPGAVATTLYGINDAGDLVGTYSLGHGNVPFVDVGGTVQEIRIRASHNQSLTFPHGINNAGEFVGYYHDDVAMNNSAFFGSSAAQVKAPIAFPGVTNTFLSGLNDDGLAVGSIDNGTDATQAILFQLPHSFTTYAYPRAIRTRFDDINSSSLICGSYAVRGTFYHGILARATPRADQ